MFVFDRFIVLIFIRKGIMSLINHVQNVTERLPLYHNDDASYLTPSALSPSVTGAKQAAVDLAANATVGPLHPHKIPPQSPYASQIFHPKALDPLNFCGDCVYLVLTL